MLKDNHIQKPTVLFTALRGYALYSSRLVLMQSLRNEGVHIVAASTQDEYFHRLQHVGVNCRTVPYARGGLNPGADWQACKALRKVVRDAKPDLVHCFQPKPLIFSALASGLPRKTRLVATVTGLGGLVKLLQRPFIGGIAKRILNSSLCRCDAIIFQNSDDKAFLEEFGVNQAARGKVILGSGVDLFRFSFDRQDTNGPVRVLMASRLLWNKGVAEYINAARECIADGMNVIFEIGGELDNSHQEAVPKEWLEKQSDAVRSIGYIQNMPRKLSEVDIIVLPSYREGVPRVLLEGAASGIPLVTTDAPGCRETVIDGKTGFLVPPRDSEALANAMKKLIQSSRLRQKMGAAGRELVEERFDIQNVTARYLYIYRELGLVLDT